MRDQAGKLSGLVATFRVDADAAVVQHSPGQAKSSKAPGLLPVEAMGY
jgi:hypothetical protein